MTPYTSYDFIIYIIIGNENAYVNSFWQNKDRDVCEVLLCLFCHATSTDAQHDLPESAIRSGHLARPQVRLLNRPFRVKMHANFLMSLDTSKTTVLSIFSNFLIQTLFAQTLMVPQWRWNYFLAGGGGGTGPATSQRIL